MTRSHLAGVVTFLCLCALSSPVAAQEVTSSEVESMGEAASESTGEEVGNASSDTPESEASSEPSGEPGDVAAEPTDDEDAVLYCYEEEFPACQAERRLSLTDYRNLVTVDLGATISGRVSLEYERALARHFSVTATLYTVLFDSVFNNDLVGYGLSFGARIYMVGAAPEGLNFDISFGSIYRRIRGNAGISLGGIELTGLMGYSLVIRRFVLSLGLGASMFYGRLSVENHGTPLRYEDESETIAGVQLGPTFRVGVGTAF